MISLACVLPFLGLTPYLVEAAGLHQWVVDAARMQLNYGALIVTFLGAVHWGLAMTSTLTGPRAAVMLRERYLWSVGPALLAWPVLSMETAPGSLMIALLLH
ncbi:Tr-type G domain-containing protein [Haematococcus lacustris]|uniref:Tr-type G domain-containing protein n=1 Tax=Haematococcus lacustris TaxID=44745 RepID=A0A6A0A591_HAELA|nr:Tr-type G domain-containing protein [Haematococcus lacustris]